MMMMMTLVSRSMGSCLARGQLIMLLLGALLSQASASSFTDKTLDCSSIKDISDLESYPITCEPVAKYDAQSASDGPRDDRTLARELDIVERCTCLLVRRSIVWQSMLTHEIEFMYLAAKTLIEQKTKEDADSKSLAKPTESNPMFTQSAKEGEFALLWDRFNALLSTINIEMYGPELSDQYMIEFAKIYYSSEKFEMTYHKNTQTPSILLKQFITNNCYQLLFNFGTFTTYFKNLRIMSKNPRFLFRAVSYDDALPKLFVAINMCRFLATSGSLLK